MIIDEDAYLKHYGTPRHSGRYPWGSGGNTEGSQRNPSFLDYVAQMKAEGLTEAQIIQGLGMTSTEFRQRRSLANAQRKQAEIAEAQKLKDKGMSNVAIGQRMGKNESSIRALLADGEADKALILDSTSDMLKDQLQTKTYLDVGAGVQHEIGISKSKLDTAVSKLQDEGYAVHKVQVDQLGTDRKTTIKVLAPPGTEYVDIVKNLDAVDSVMGYYTEDGGRSWLGVKDPISVDPKRVSVKWGPEGGADADGVMYIRPGVDDLSLGSKNYAQVRVKVGDGHYLKGMAMYKDDLPPGVDIQFNTNKDKTANKLDAMKKLKDDPDNPFGSVVRQLHDADGNLRSAMNIVNDEGQWGNWSKSLSSQMLSKQQPSLAKTQLDETYSRKQKELDEIMALTNPTVRRKLLETYSDGVDSAAVHLKAAALPRQRTQVLLPLQTIKDTEVYAPNFDNGEKVVLIRYPHGGIFEIPEVTVNNNHPEGKKLIGALAEDAIGISPRVAQQLSGADFDGDTVLVIPNNNRKVKTAPALEQLKGFDPQRLYKLPDEAPAISARAKQKQMGQVSNLITDMTIKGASMDEISRAVRHSMVVIDAEKHRLDVKRSAQDFGIAALKDRYQTRSDSDGRGASTLISRATSDKRVNQRKERGADPTTGKRVFEETGAGYYKTKTNKRTGETTKVWIPKLTKTTQLGDTDDARTLSSGTVMEEVYASHSNKMKGLANRARRESLNTPRLKSNPAARKAYSKEVEQLKSALVLAESNAPRERRAQVLGNSIYRQKLDATPDMEPTERKKVKYLALEEARRRTGAKKTRVSITPDQWAAIQAGAISDNMLKNILTHADMDVVRALATPKTQVLMSSAKTQRARSMAASGYTQAQIADALGVSLTTLKNAIN